MNIEEVKKVLSRTAIFNSLDSKQQTQLAQACHLHKYAIDEEVIKEGDSGDGLYIIIEGKLSVFLPQKSRLKKEERLSKVILNTLESGNCFGEYSLLDGHYVSATIMALEATSILKIDKGDFQKIMDNNLYIAKTIYGNLARLYISRLRKYDEELDQFFIY